MATLHLPVLLVDDSPADRARLEPVLDQGVTQGVTVALDADEALAAVRRQSFAAILLAQDLAGRSGLDLLRELRASGDQTPVILMTAEGRESLTETALRAGAAACLVKRTGFEATLPGLLERTAVPAPRRPRHATRTGKVLVFELGGHLYGLFAEDVDLVSHAVAIAPLPGAPAGVEGVVDVQGDLVPVLDLRARLGLAHEDVDPNEHLVVARAGDQRIAIRVDRAAALASVDANDLETGALLPYGVAAMARLDGELVPIHDPATFLTESAWAQLGAARGTREGGG